MKGPEQLCVLLKREELGNFCTPDECCTCGWNRLEDKRRRALIDGGNGLHTSRTGRRYLILRRQEDTKESG